jgi:hypothetical protein
MKLSERFILNIADAYVLLCSGFPMERIAELDHVYQQFEEILCFHVFSLAEPILLEHDDYSEIITPSLTLLRLKGKIDHQFTDVSSDARQTIWSFASQYLWNYSHRILSDIQNERRFQDPELGEFFRFLKEAKKNGLFGSSSLLE